MDYIFYCDGYEEVRSFSESTTKDVVDAEFDLWAANYEYENKVDDIENLIITGQAGYCQTD